MVLTVNSTLEIIQVSSLEENLSLKNSNQFSRLWEMLRKTIATVAFRFETQKRKGLVRSVALETTSVVLLLTTE